MKKEISVQWIVGLAIIFIGGGVMGGEFFLVKWLPHHRQAVKDETLKPVPYKNDKLGIELQISSGLMGEVEEFAGGVRISRPKFWSIGPSLTITSQPNPDGTFEFDPKMVAAWQTEGIYKELPRYHYAREKINNRDAVLIWQYRTRAMELSVHVITSEHLIELYCTPGKEDEEIYMQACEETVHTLKVAGAEPPPLTEPMLDLTKPPAKAKGR